MLLQLRLMPWDYQRMMGVYSPGFPITVTVIPTGWVAKGKLSDWTC
jgi:hypothetical protein